MTDGQHEPGPQRPRHYVVVDGSNLATEGRTVPSLDQLDSAVRAYAAEDPDAEIIVVVDASFEHRIDSADREKLEQAELHGEVVSPPAGAIGRGDAFVLRIAERTGAAVLSNDSFQEFHDEHPWLFEEGRLIGGKPVPGVGWIFTPRLPVRGPKSRQATARSRGKRAAEDGKASEPVMLTAPDKAAEVAKAAKKTAAKRGAPALAEEAGAGPAEPAKKAAKKAAPAKKAAKKAAPAEKAAKKAAPAKKAAKKAAPAEKAPPLEGGPKAPAAQLAAGKKSATKRAAPAEPAPALATPARTQRGRADERVQHAIDDAVAEVSSAPVPIAPPAQGKEEGARSRGRSRRRSAPLPAVNEPLAFITFVATYPVGSELEGEVVSFTSHGAMVDVELPDGTALHCYVPISGLGVPPPNKAREVLRKGERRPFVLVGLDPPRRVAELAVPEAAPAALEGATG